MAKNIKQAVKKYYGEEIQETADLKTNVCVPLDSIPDYMGSVISLVNDEIKRKYYGCGSPIPLCTEGLKVLDVGCGTGRDCYYYVKAGGRRRVRVWYRYDRKSDRSR